MKTLLAGCAFALLSITTALAAPLGEPAGETVLTITGDIANTNGDGVATFDKAMLEALERRTATMETPWTEGKVAFEGPLLKAILDAAGAQGKTLIVKALNDYSAEVPMEDAQDFPTMLAIRMNGEEMSVRDKGPLFMIYPFDKHPELYNEKYFSRSVWQIKEIEVVD
ncbi:molybdopterin-dependent oxidoreductase [Aquibium sp. ELW1220]|uniref:molybdopterin-dependent oxidoreductase n=1 Tax=Aquibium sp. ELW1220 TaxID=2976766 RepID=UPI0025AF824D|nr:molybdopterin-dependent oxidoreductase [Aquibium sp. ELW1220]MDN2581669.1 molybdopterin-dependent oxidoreductase [Aquibium sp. ELW1220]